MQDDSSKPTISILPHWISDMIHFWKPVVLDPQLAASFRVDLLIDIIEANVGLLAAALDPRYGNLPWIISTDLRDVVWEATQRRATTCIAGASAAFW